MNHEKFDPVHHVQTRSGMTANALLLEMKASGVMAGGALAKSADVLESMILDQDCVKFVGVAGAMIPGGMRQVLVDMVDDGWCDVFVTTGAMLTHDLVEGLGFHHYQGNAFADDSQLNELGYDRMWDSYMPNTAYIELERFCKKAFAALPMRALSIREFLYELGKQSPKGTLMRACADKSVPLFCPAIADCGLGLQTISHLERQVLAFEDLKEIADISWQAKKKGVFYVGGGTPKNYIQQAMQFAPKPADYAVQITIDRPEAGGSSGAELREGISWGKLNPKGSFVNVYADATICLPLLSAALKERLKGQAGSPGFRASSIS